jgi:protein-tyrosine-phosphatase
VAEGFFKRYNKNKKYKVKSAGIIRGSPISKEIKASGKRFGLNLNSKPRGMSTELLKWNDVMVIVANDVPKELFKDHEHYGKKLIVWKVPDVMSNNAKAIDKTVALVEKKVKTFVGGLK